MKSSLVFIAAALCAAHSVGADYRVFINPAEADTKTSGQVTAPKPPSSSVARSARLGDKECSKRSLRLTQQTLAYLLDSINPYNPIWFSDLDKDELLHEQKQSLGNMILASTHPLNGDGKPLFEIEASYFRSLSGGHPVAQGNRSAPFTSASNLSLRLMRQHADQCYLIGEGDQARFVLVLGVSLGPVEHHLDVVYNLPRVLRLTQPMDWKYAQVRLTVPRMNYQLTLRQAARHRVGAGGNCPLELADLTYLNAQGSGGAGGKISVIASGLPSTGNQTLEQLERLFTDYTRPTVSRYLRQVLRFYLSDKTLPLSVG